MELEPLFVNIKWDILQVLSNQESTPNEIANKLHTTVPNISQQLKILEAAGLINKKRAINQEKGKSRIVLSLSDDYGYIVSFMRGYSNKRLIKLDDYHRYVLSTWCSFDSEYHFFLERLYWKIHPYHENIEAYTISQDKENLLLTLIADKKLTLPDNIILKHGNSTKTIFIKTAKTIPKHISQEGIFIHIPSRQGETV